MAVGRISGPLLKANLERNGIDLAVEGNLLYIDVNNGRIGVKTSAPQYDLDVNGIIRSQRIDTDFLHVASNYNLGNVNITSTLGALQLQPATEFDRTIVIGDLEVTGEILNYSSGFNIVNDASSSIFVDQGSDLRFSDGVDTVISFSSDATHEIIEVNNTSTLDSVTGRGSTTLNSISVGSITTPLVVGDVKGSVFADDSSVMVDAVGNVLYANQVVTPQITAATTLNINTGGDYTVSSPSNIQMNATSGAVYIVSPITDLSGTLQVGTIDTSDSSAITVIPPVNFNADVIAENDLQVNNHATVTRDLNVNGDIAIPDNSRIKLGDGGDLAILHNGTNTIFNNSTGTLTFNNFQDDGSIVFNTDDGAGGTTNYIRMTGSTGEVLLYHYGSEKLATKSTGVEVTGNLVVSGQLETSIIDTSDSSAITITPATVFSSDVTVENDLIVTNKVTAAEFIGDGSQLTGLVATYADLTDTDITGRTANSLTRFDGANYVPTALSEDASGNVTVAGQLNVSTIDTADSSAITITPAAVFSSDLTVENDLTVTNKVTAAEFIGDGSQLTNLTAANLTGAVPNNFITLGQDTTGNYVQTATGTLNEIEVQFSGTESSDIQIGLPNNVTIGGELTVTTGLFTPLIDTSDSSPLTITPAVVMNSDLTVENGLKVNSIETTDSSSLDILNAVIMRSDLNVENDVDVRNVVRATYFEGDGSRLTGVALEGGGGAVRAEEFPTVTNGSPSVTMSQAYPIDKIDVYLNGVRLKPVVDFTVSGTTLTFNENLDAIDSVALYAYDTAELFTPTVRLEEFPIASGGSPNVTMSGIYELDAIDVYLNGARLKPTDDYTVSGTTLTFSGNLDAADIVALYVYDTAKALTFEYAKVEEFPTVTNGSPDVTISQAYHIDQLDVYLNGARLKPGDDFTVSGTTVTLGTNLATNDVVAVVISDFAYRLTGSTGLNEINDVSVAGQATDTLIRYDGTNYVPTQTAEDASGNLNVAGQLNVSTIDTTDSSAITITPDVVMSAGLTVGNHIVPSSNENIDLGSASFRFRDLYLSGESIDLGGVQITKLGSAIALPAGSTIGGLDVAVKDASGNLVVSGQLETSTIDTSDSSALAVTPAVIFSSDITVENDIVSNNRVEAVDGYTMGGLNSFRFLTGDDSSFAIGPGSLRNWAQSVAGYNNIAIGKNVLTEQRFNGSNIGIGSDSQRESTGFFNVGIGRSSLYANDSQSNVAIGDFTLSNSTTGAYNTAVGYVAGNDITTGERNVTVGAFSSGQSTTGNYNVAMGYAALENVTNDLNVVIGYFAGNDLTTGFRNTVIGSYALDTGATSAQENVAIGSSAMGSGVGGTKNVAVGRSAGLNIASDFNTVIGADAGTTIIAGSNLSVIGYDAEPSAAGATNEITLGNASVTKLRVPGAGFELTSGTAVFDTKIEVPVIDTADSSAITITPAAVFSSDVTVENDLVVTNKVTAADVTASNTIQDAQGNVRVLEVTVVNSTPYTVASGSSGKYFGLGTGSSVVTINDSNFSAGDIITIYNRLGTDATINFSGFTTAHIAGDGTNKTSMTLAAYGLCTMIYDRSSDMVVNGNVS